MLLESFLVWTLGVTGSSPIGLAHVPLPILPCKMQAGSLWDWVGHVGAMGIWRLLILGVPAALHPPNPSQTRVISWVNQFLGQFNCVTSTTRSCVIATAPLGWLAIMDLCTDQFMARCTPARGGRAKTA
ncbi:hypothetical protein FQA47_011821 [Oryzias melastigma]|uniref:Uncharacterized protein n=1 Tax=Oryzias melastigma TaxID=30732 RepID=A0A834CPD3_ORYME|nr:hypothetical protein FQA47_011821 [Oryzias melastigma]